MILYLLAGLALVVLGIFIGWTANSCWYADNPFDEEDDNGQR